MPPWFTTLPAVVASLACRSVGNNNSALLFSLPLSSTVGRPSVGSPSFNLAVTSRVLLTQNLSLSSTNNRNRLKWTQEGQTFAVSKCWILLTWYGWFSPIIKYGPENFGVTLWACFSRGVLASNNHTRSPNFETCILNSWFLLYCSAVRQFACFWFSLTISLKILNWGSIASTLLCTLAGNDLVSERSKMSTGKLGSNPNTTRKGEYCKFLTKLVLNECPIVDKSLGQFLWPPRDHNASATHSKYSCCSSHIDY